MNGILVVDKPSGPTSHDICQYFKRNYPVKKVGHAGTLDPLASGVLIILLDQATKMQSIFLKKDKEYQFTMKLGEATDTYDSEGVVTHAIPDGAVIPAMPAGRQAKAGIQQIEAILPQFRGPILQKPPIYSALKKAGTPLYKLARRGETVETVEIPERAVTIYSLEIVETNFPFVTLKARCSSGTYVRSLAHDIGQVLGVGAHVTALRRLRSEPFGIEEAMQLPNF
ncbi:MAG: tRNA pseudouridine(55) synthase TruB [Deltaproteobacteria bacterium]|nr:tRNA pseudouridine(55) synthase TruB [Deltaproteobacteria bacterium]